MKRIFENFDVKTDGTIVRNKDGRTMKCCVDNAGYMKFSPRFNGEKIQVKVHRLVAIKYIPNPNNYQIVNHINGIKTDNRIENLEWCDCKQNIQHAHKTKLATNKHRKIKVNQIDINTGEVIKTYDSYRQASIETGVLETNISACCRKYTPKNRPNARYSAGGYRWETCND